MPSHGFEVSLQLRVAIATCRPLYHETSEAIERKIGVNASTAAAITRRVIDRAGNEDFNDIMAWLGVPDWSMEAL